jgi:hypothetical protein
MMLDVGVAPANLALGASRVGMAEQTLGWENVQILRDA